MEEQRATKAELLSRIEDAASGLLYPSESDFPLIPLVFASPDGAEPTPEALLHAEGLSPNTPVEAVSLAELFEPLMEEREGENGTDATRFRALFELLSSELADIRVLRIGSVNIDIHVLGRQASGEWIDLKTKAVET
jgi:hypothetical protein